MILFLIKSTVCMGILLAVYHLLLRGEKMYTFNRFYLLFSLCFAFTLPFIEIETSAETIPFSEITTFNRAMVQPDIVAIDETPLAPTQHFFFIFILIIYSIGSLIFLFRFIRNLTNLSRRIISNPTINYKKAKLVLLDEKVLPYTFLHYIFVNKKDHELQRIEQELYTHEFAHVCQKHTLDILFIELLKIAFWFHPLIYFFKKAIKLNHEFMADEAVIKSHNDISAYQYILFTQLCRHQPSSLASSFKYSFTKKRFTMMTKNISPVQIILKKVALVPVFLMLVLVFATQTLSQEIKQDQQPDKKSVVANQQAIPGKKELTLEDSLKIIENLWKNSTIKIPRKKEDGSFVHVTYAEMTEEERLRLPLLQIPKKNPPTQEQLDAWTDPKKYGVWVDGERMENDLLKNFTPSDFGNFFVSGLTKTAKNYGKHEFQVNIMTLSYFEDWQEKRREAWEIGK